MLRLARQSRGLLILLVIIQAWLAIQLGTHQGELGGPDVYMWLSRATELWTNGDWFEPAQSRINPPHGHASHWTRPFDVILLAGAAVGTPFVGFADALYGWAVIVSPVLQAVSLLALLWALMPIFNRDDRELLGFLFITQMGVLATFAAGRADHQSLHLTLFVISLGFVTRMLVAPLNVRHCRVAGLVTALAIWASVESIILIFVTVLALGGCWLFSGGDLAKKLRHYHGALFGGSALATVLQHGHAAHLPNGFDQLSVEFVALFGALWVYWLLAERAAPALATAPRRVLAAIVGAVVIVIFMQSVFPGFLLVPALGTDELVRRDELYQAVRSTRIVEGRPLLNSLAMASEGLWNELAHGLLWLGIALVAIPVMAWKLVRDNHPHRRTWGFLILGATIYLYLTVKSIRWIPYAAILLLPAYAWAVASVMRRLTCRFPGHSGAVLRASVVVLAVTWPLVPTMVLKARDQPMERASERCPLQAMAGYLAAPDGLGARRRNLMAFVDFGPELLYRTPHFVYSVPNHRYQSGFRDTYALLAETDVRAAEAVAHARSVELVLLCRHGAEVGFYDGDADAPSLHARLIDGRVPYWMDQLDLPSELAEDFLLFEVTH